MPLLRPLSDRVKGLLSGLGGAALWLCEWAGDKIFGDTAFGWMRDMVSPLSQYEWVRIVWIYGVPLVLATLSLYFFWRAGVRPSAEQVASSKNVGLAPARVEPVARQPTSPLPSLSRQADSIPLNPTDELSNWQILFTLQEDGTIRLKIYPDTPSTMRDAFCLLLLAYDVIKGMNEVPKALIEPEMRRLTIEEPQTPMQRAMGVDHLMRAHFIKDFGQSSVEAGNVQRVGLSSGIRYKLMPRARRDCLNQARDLIRRA